MPGSPLSIRRFRVIFLLCWGELMINQALVLHLFNMSWRTAVIDSLISNSLLLLAGLLILQILRYYMPRGQQFINIFALVAILTIVWLVLIRWLLMLTMGQEENYSSIIRHSLTIRFSIGFLLLGCVTMIGILWFNQQEQKETDKRKTDAEKLAREAELFKLRQQLQPHFLFNSLNSINALIGSRPEEARKMVQQLSDFLRGTIRKEDTQWVTLGEELQYLGLYLDIEKVRFGNRLATDIQTTPEAEQMKLPALLLQPIVENAIKFGLYDTTGETVIRLEAGTDEKGNLLIRVENPFDPETSSPKQGTGFGLSSVQRRLYLLFARTDLVQTGAAGAIFTTTVKIPQPQSV